ncbi:hypothetical protein LR48_Vigan04g017500 [Vigna angularis]|uniref:Transmembrane protein n=2 Tax=Phaseolus angularis TaxID=3914 RepID=A0A0L9UBS1_PHAAN|nr:uncharacterized protein LOC108331033 [Vigna angularis]KAG2398692.1 uncharacterized protein HKW66_Vig0088270 [Vigna angularis]KOM39977.1 hypothetical protein LR48_Vigan04g017500 [Vigna angularis]BAT80014.1 hypothetical protein VIGAN_02297200 [Vigna angularis var. angularis]
MNVLDSNVEALAFNYLSFGLLTALHSLWTWLALLTAALSFWKIRSAGCPRPTPIPIPETQPSAGPDRQTSNQEKTEPTREAVNAKGGAEEDVDGVRKGKFTAYYEEHVKCTCESESENEGFATACEESDGSGTEWWERWERLLRLRNGESENGWYTWQDVTELNGNVVRLWDGGLTGSFARESWYSNSNRIHVW